MSAYTEQLATDIVYPNIEVYRQYEDGNLYGYRVTPADGYVMYNKNRNDTEPGEDPETGEMIEIPVTYYYTVAYLNPNYNFANFPWVAVLRSGVNEDYIFGGGGNNSTEVM